MSSLTTALLEHNTTAVLTGVHDKSKCAGEVCCIHNRSNHKLRTLPQSWRNDWGGMMERICSHGVGHPDPDWLAGKDPGDRFDVHGCDGCC